MTARASRLAPLVAGVAAFAFALVAIWEIGAPLEGGHWASMSACAIAAENMLRFHLFAAVTQYVTSPPPEHAQYYCRHPYAIYVMEAFSRALFGHRAWAIRVPAVVCSAATPIVLYRLGRELWGPVPAAVATVGFVVVPIDLAFATFSSLEVPTILFSLVFCLGTVRVWREPKPRDVVLAAVGAIGACNSDWIGAVFVGTVLVLGLARARFVRGAWRPAIDAPLYKRWLVATTTIVLGTLVLYTALIVHAGRLQDVLYGAKLRSSGDSLAWHVLANPIRWRRLVWMVPGVGFGVLIAALPVAAYLWKARPGEAVLLAWTLTASVQYLGFREGADIHIFWPHYYGPCVALALGTLTSALLSIERAGLAGALRIAGLVGFVGLPIAALARVGIPMLDQSRLTQGRFDESGHHIESGADASLFAEWATKDLPTSSILHCTRLCSWHVEYATGLAEEEGPIDLSGRAKDDRDRIELVDARYASADELRALSRAFETVSVGPFLRVDRATPGLGVRAMVHSERQPTGLERAFVTDHDLVRAIGSETDPWATWEWADALGTPITFEPAAEPANLYELTVAHNLAGTHGDRARAEALRSRALALVDTSHGAELTGDLRLLGVGIERGAATVVTLLWETGAGFLPVESTFAVRCHVTEPPPLWPVPVDPREKEMAPPMAIKPSLWKPDHLYAQRFIALHRPGVEECRGSFTKNAPSPANGAPAVDLFTLR